MVFCRGKQRRGKFLPPGACYRPVPVAHVWVDSHNDVHTHMHVRLFC